MSPETKKTIQLVLLLAFLLATARMAYVFYQRHQDAVAAAKKKAGEIGYTNADYYVIPKKLYPYDLKSAKQLTQQPVWVKEGYRYTYYPYDPPSKRVAFDHEAGLLLPIAKLAIKDVVTSVPKGAGQQRQAMAIFEKDGKSYAVPIAYESDGTYKFYADEMFYYDDPHDLYKHWPADVWQAVDQHQVKAGMTELQAVFAIGMGVPDAGDTPYSKTVRYPNGGNPVVIVYHDGKAAEIRNGS